MPDETWRPIPGQGAALLHKDEVVATLALAERAPVAPLSASEHVQVAWPLLEASLEGFEPGDVERIETDTDLDVVRLSYRCQDTRRGAVERSELFVATGALLIRITLDCPVTMVEELADELHAVLASFRLEGGGHIVEAQPTALFAAEKDEPSSETAPIECPWLGLIVAAPEGWKVLVNEEELTLRSSLNATLTLRSLSGATDDHGAWLQGRVAALAEERNCKISAWQSGAEIEPHARYLAGLRYRRTVGGRWDSRDQEQVELLTGDPGSHTERSAVWQLDVPRGTPVEPAVSGLHHMVRARQVLDSSRWQLRTSETWLRLVLAGPWRAEGAGLYVRQGDGTTYLIAHQTECARPIEHLRPDMTTVIDTHRGDGALLDVFNEKEVVGSLRGVDAYRYSLDAAFQASGRRAIRGVGLVGKGLLSIVVLDAPLSDTGVDDLYRSVLTGLAVPGMEGS